MTITTPWRRMTLHFSHRALTDAETFTIDFLFWPGYFSR
jgi:hypothetical protein